MEVKKKGSWFIRRIHGLNSLQFMIAFLGLFLLIGSSAEVIMETEENINACDNFYKYTCKMNLGMNKTVNNTVLMPHKIEEYLNQTLNSNDEKNSTKSYKLLKTYYKSCMEASENETDKIERFKKDLKSAGGWPIIEGDSWDGTDFDLFDTMKKMYQLGLMSKLISVDVKKVPENQTYVISLSPDMQLLVGSPENFDDKKKQAYLDIMADIVKELGAKGDHITDDLLQILDFELKLTNLKLSVNADDENKLVTNKQTLNKECFDGPWFEFLKTNLPDGFIIEDDQVIEVQFPDFLMKIVRFLKWKSPRTIANHVMWTSAYNSLEYLSNKMQDYKEALSLILFPNVVKKSKNREIWRECIQSALQIKPAFASIWIRDHFDLETKYKVVEMFERLRNTVIDLLYQNTEVDPAIKRRIIEKIESMAAEIAYPDELFNHKKVDDYFDGLDLSEDSFLENSLKISRFFEDKEYAKLTEPYGKYLWIDFDPMFIRDRIFYNILLNTFDIPLGSILANSFNKNSPLYMSYSQLGISIGREFRKWVIPSFILPHDDDQLFPSTEKISNERRKCIIDLLSNYTTNAVDKKIKKRAHAVEIDALTLVYTAYDRWVKENGEEEGLPGIEESPRQLFWLNYAKSFCPIDCKLRESRINSLFSALPEFVNDFKCPLGSNMNPICPSSSS